MARAPRERRHRKSFFDTVGVDRAIILIRTLPWAVFGGGTIGLIGGVMFAPRMGLPPLVGLVVGFVAGTLIALYVTSFIVESGAGLALRTLQPDGTTTPYAFDFSQIEAHVVRGEFAAAAVLWTDAIAERPGDPEVRVRAGDFFAGPGGDALRAQALFREVQAMPTAPPERLLYVSQRLVDLYLGPLGDKGRAVVELRRIIDRWPQSAPARHGREALARLKAELHAD